MLTECSPTVPVAFGDQVWLVAALQHRAEPRSPGEWHGGGVLEVDEPDVFTDNKNCVPQ